MSKLIKDNVDVEKKGEKYFVKRVIEEEYEDKEMRDIVNNMEKQLESLNKQLKVLKKEKERLEKQLKFWKEKVKR